MRSEGPVSGVGGRIKIHGKAAMRLDPADWWGVRTGHTQ